jgi:serine/threonine protein kinase
MVIPSINNYKNISGGTKKGSDKPSKRSRSKASSSFPSPPTPPYPQSFKYPTTPPTLSPSMEPEPEVIGEGSYGCVHYPSLKCNDPGVDYNNKVSKILLDRHAQTELDEYLGIQRADPKNQFFLGVPMRCKPEQTERNFQAIGKCSRGALEARRTYPSKLIKPEYDLLIMEDGGMNLHDFAKNMESRPVNRENQDIMEKFWVECHRIFLGLTVFSKENIMHHDLKAENIVYNPMINRSAFIDFGLMRPFDRQKRAVERNDPNSIVEHWSYPVESVFYYNKNYKKLIDENAKKTITENIYNRGIDKWYDRDGAFLSNVLPRNTTFLDKSDQDYRITRDGFLELITYDYIDLIQSITPEYRDEFLDKSLRTFDLYGVGMGLLYVFNKTYQFLKGNDKVKPSKIDYHSLHEFLYHCITPLVVVRFTVEQALDNYETNVLGFYLRKEKRIAYVEHLPVELPPLKLSTFKKTHKNPKKRPQN